MAAGRAGYPRRTSPPRATRSLKALLWISSAFRERVARGSATTAGNHGARPAFPDARGGDTSEQRSHEFPKVVEKVIMLKFCSEPDDARSVLSVVREHSDADEKLASSALSPSNRSMAQWRQCMGGDGEPER
ncbi:unnamed protein product [Lota lota]